MVSASESFKVLGVVWTLFDRTTRELQSRIAAAWAKFHHLRPLLCKQTGSQQKRLRLFDKAVTASLLWACESWTLTKREQRQLTSVQNTMLRRIVVSRRHASETWVEWVKRSTRQARAVARRAGIRCWVAAYLEAKWKWAGHIMRMGADRPARCITEWRDSECSLIEDALHGNSRDRRRRCRRQRWFRWEDCFRKYTTLKNWTSWQTSAKNRDRWRRECKSFVKMCV